MTVPAAPDLERLAGVAALERPAQAKRMLVIVNPYATTMSDRLKHLVVYALQGRYDVTAIDTQRKGHAIELVAEAARERYDVVVAFGGDGTVNEAANGLAGTDTPLTCLPGGSNNVFGKMLGIPNDVVDATEHLLALSDRWEPRARRPRPRQRARVHVRRRHGARRERRRARRREPGHEAPLRPLVLHREGGRHVHAQVRRAPAQALGQRRRRRADRRRQRLLPERPALHVLQGAARSTSRRARGWTRATSRASCSRARTPSTSRRCIFRALSTARDPRPPPRGGVRGRARGGRSAPATAGRCRGRSTATTSATTKRCGSRSTPGTLQIVA